MREHKMFEFKFIEGRSYESCDAGVEPITIIKRTSKTILAKNSTSTWRMKIRQDKKGNEYVVDSCVPSKWKEMYTYKAEWEVK